MAISVALVRRDTTRLEKEGLRKFVYGRGEDIPNYSKGGGDSSERDRVDWALEFTCWLYNEIYLVLVFCNAFMLAPILQ